MPLQLPNLDDRTYRDLADEARRQIAAFDPTWTNHNPSDPGITLIELFAYLTEILLYRLNRVTDANQRRFLKLLNAPGTPLPADLAEATQTTIRTLRARFRAVTVADYERLVSVDFNAELAESKRAEQAGAVPERWWVLTRAERVPANNPSQAPAVGRVHCLAGRNLERGSEQERTRFQAGHVSLVVIPERTELEQPPQLLTDAVFGFLDERRTVTTRLHVVGPTHAPVSAEIVIARTADAVEDQLRAAIVTKLEGFLDPVKGGGSGQGWPFGRDVFVSELIEQLEAISGVDYVTDIRLGSTCTTSEPRCVDAAELWHDEGDQIGLALAGHHLPLPRIDPDQIEIAASANMVVVTVRVTVSSTTLAPSAVKRLVKNSVRSFFHPLHGAPVPVPQDPPIPPDVFPFAREFRIAALSAALQSAALTTTVEVEADAARFRKENGESVSIGIVPDKEIVNFRVLLEFPPAGGP